MKGQQKTEISRKFKIKGKLLFKNVLGSGFPFVKHICFGYFKHLLIRQSIY